MARFSEGLGALRDGRQLGLALRLSVVAWAIAGTGTIASIAAFHLPTPWYAGFFVLAIVNLGGAIPSSPGSLSVWVTDKNAALGYALGTHGMNMLLTIVLGCVCLAREGISFRSIGVAHHVV